MQSPLAVQQLVSRAGLALAHALAHRASALTVLHAGFGPKLAAIAQIEVTLEFAVCVFLGGGGEGGWTTQFSVFPCLACSQVKFNTPLSSCMQTPIPIGDPTSAKFEDLERSLARLSEVFSDAKMLLSLPEVAVSWGIIARSHLIDCCPDLEFC